MTGCTLTDLHHYELSDLATMEAESPRFLRKLHHQEKIQNQKVLITSIIPSKKLHYERFSKLQRNDSNTHIELFN